MAKRKRTKNDLQNITHTRKDRVTQTPLKTGSEPSLTRTLSDMEIVRIPVHVDKCK